MSEEPSLAAAPIPSSSGKGRYREITQPLLLASTSLTKSSRESADAYLKRVTHLHLQNKRINKISGLDDCKNLKVSLFYCYVQNYLVLLTNHFHEIFLLFNVGVVSL